MDRTFFFFLFFFALGYAEDSPREFTAKTESGIVIGAKKKAYNGQEYVSFLGIPYAKGPLAELRFAEPQKPDLFDGVFNATSEGPSCPQLPFVLAMPPALVSEDCLRVNIHVPLSALPKLGAEPSKPLLPVYAYIHGGRFVYGSGYPSTYAPEYLVSKGIILVTFNYRLGLLGFLSLNSSYIPGNAGLKDVLFATKWIKNNIKNFGGDPEEITLAGQSSGGVMAHLLAISPATKGLDLFKRVMILSGTAILNFFTPSPAHAKKVAKLCLTQLNISSNESDQSVYQTLIKTPIEKMLEIQKNVESKIRQSLIFVPVIETAQPGITNIVPKDPEYLLNDGFGKEYATMIGFTNNECELFRELVKTMNIEMLLKILPFMSVPYKLLYSSNKWTIPVLTKMISNEYFNGTSPNLDQYINMCTDSNYKYAALRTTQKRLDVGSEPTFMYEFSYHGEPSLLKQQLHLDWPGAGHAEDVIYIFGNYTSKTYLAQFDSNSKMSELMSSFVANFVKTGRPTLSPAAWPRAGQHFGYQSIEGPTKHKYQRATPYLMDKKKFFDKLYRIVFHRN